MKTMLIGICGGSGSGKTTLARKILEYLGPEKASLINMDSFYKYQPNTTYEERTKTNYDHPNAFDVDLFFNSLGMLKDGKDVQIPVYDFTIHNRAEGEWKKVEARPVILVDGILLFTFPEIVNLLDLKIYVDSPADIRILRRLVRDMSERARSVDSIVSQYLTTVKPMHDQFTEPNKNEADIIVPDGGFNENAFKLITTAIDRYIEDLVK